MAANKFIQNSILIFYSLNLGCAHYDKEPDNIIGVIDEVFDDIEKNRVILKSAVLNAFQHKEERKADNCVCVPYFLCEEQDIVTNGRFLVQNRYKEKECNKLGEICCPIDSVTLPPNGNPPDTVLECGMKNTDFLQTDSQNNYTTSFAEFPWTAIVLKNKNHFQCGGVLIHPQAVLTSAHCINNSEKYSVRVGEWDASNQEEPLNDQQQQVQNIIIHPLFDYKNLKYDVAILLLKSPFQLTPNVNVVCLSSYATENYETCLSTGWGKNTYDGNYKRVMKKVQLAPIPNEVCEEKLQSSKLGKWFQLHNSFLCAHTSGTEHICLGDGGNPLVCKISDDNERYQLVGVTSWGLECGHQYPTVFAKINSVLKWIEDQLSLYNFNLPHHPISRSLLEL